ncbi:MAG: hypothetical protein ACRDLY_02490 [Thermoleophilaceae bacterium]
MAISRPFLLALLGAVLVGATFFVMQTARDNSADDAAPSAEAAPEQAAAPAEPVATPEQTLATAFSTSKLESASFDAKLALHFEGETGTVRLSGAFENPGAKQMPKVALNVKTHAPREQDLDVGFVTTGDKAWFTEGDTGHAVPAGAWSQVVQAREQGTGTQQQLPLPVNPEHWLRDVKSEGTETIGGVETEHVSARVDAPTALRDLLEFAQQGGQAPAGILPEGAEERINDFVKRAEFDVWVGDDDALRRLTADLELAVPGRGAIEAELALDLTKIGEPQRIAAPAKVAPGLPGGQYGELTRGFLSGVAVSTGADPAAVTAAASTSPRLFRRALDQKRKVVLFFGQGAADDRATADAVHALERSNKQVLVLTDHVDNVDAYGKLVEQLNVYQAPAIVIVGRSGNARLLEGYVDAGVLRQEVADAR